MNKQHLITGILILALTLIAIGCSKDESKSPTGSILGGGGGGEGNTALTGQWTYESASDNINPQLYIGAKMTFGTDNRFELVNPRLPDGNGGAVDHVETGTYLTNGNQLDFTIEEQQPAGSQYLTFGMGGNQGSFELTSNQLKVSVNQGYTIWVK